MLFNEDHYGKPISEKLSDFLKEWTDNNDRANIAAATNIGISTIRDVTYRNNNLTVNNSVAILELMKCGVKNYTNKFAYTKKVVEELTTEFEVVCQEL